MSTTLLHLARLFLLLSVTYAANWNTNVRPLVTERLDPIVSPNGVASHMHRILGGSAFGASYNQPDLMKSSCSSFPISVDKSNYWHPTAYWVNNNGTSFTPLPMSNRVYYIREKNSPNDYIRPFPEGLRMIVGNPNAKSANSRSISFLCRVAEKFNGDGDIWRDDWQFERDCPRGILVQMKFPPCWDGINLYKSDQSHMNFPQWGAHYGACPASHPIRLPGIMLEAYVQTNTWAPGQTVKGKSVWANGDLTGFGAHADFTNGWDTSILGRALNDTVCGTANDITFQECPVFQPFIKDTACSPDKGVMSESFTHADLTPIAQLAGCNPIWNTGPKPGCSSSLPNPDVSKFQGTDGPYVASQSAIPVLPTTSGWQEINCIKDSDNMLLNQVRYYDPNITQTSCLDACLRSGKTYASIGYSWGKSWTCDCGTGLDPLASVYNGMCNMTCPGTQQRCGGSGAHSIFYAPNGTASAGDYKQSMGCYANPAAGKVGLEQVSSYNFTSWNLMTRELCGQACADRGLDIGAIRSGGICFCIAKDKFALGDGYYQNDALCTSKCAGNATQTCGYWGGLSVFNVTSTGYKPTQMNKAPGYLQCYTDNARTSLTGAQWWDGNLSPQKCQFGCRDLGYSLASVYSGSMCLCGNDYPTNSVLPTSMCSSKCSDNTTFYTCGGPGAGELYNTSSVASQVQVYNAGRPAGWQGCYPNPANNLTADITVNEGKLSASRCISACSELGYGWAGVQSRDQCRCSKTDPRKNVKPVAANNFCNIPCNGNAQQTCGGWNYVDLYQVAPASNGTASNVTSSTGVPTSPGYQGCYNGTTGLSGYKWYAGDMTIGQCTKGCKEIGQPLAALTGGYYCTCGSTWTGGPRLTSLSCGQTCGGDNTTQCGGWPTQASVYQSLVGADTPQPPGYKGCWLETKALQGYGVWLDTQSVTGCRAICLAKNYKLSGLTNAKQCWCGDALSSASTRIPSQFCATPCPGDSSQMCGQWNSIALYASSTSGDAVPASSNNITAAPNATLSGVSSSSMSRSTITAATLSASANMTSSMTSVSTRSGVANIASASLASTSSKASNTSGASSTAITSPAATTVPSPSASPANGSCFTDSATLNGPNYKSSYMTQDTCLFWCKGKQYAFAGVGRDTCYCGNTRPSVVATLCTTTCSGSGQICGGDKAATVLFTSAAGYTDPYSSSDSVGYLGCWKDSATRLLGAASFTSSSLTRSSCLAGCVQRGYKYAGAQAGNQCYCANSLDATTVNYRVADSECGYKCSGEDAKCGGSWRISVLTTASPSTAASSVNATMVQPTTSSSLSATGISIVSVMNQTSTSGTTSKTSTSAAPGSSSSASSKSSALVAPSPSPFSTSSSLSTSPTTSSSASSTSSAAQASSTASPEYLGCYVDQSSPRTLSGYSFSNSKLTTEMCRKGCVDRGFRYYGTESSTQCYCSSDDVTASPVDEKQCGSICGGYVGISTAKCGGSWRLSVYDSQRNSTANGLVVSKRTRRGRRHTFAQLGH